MSISLRRALFPLALAMLPATILLPSIETPGPAFVDWKRGVEKQTNDARDARREVESGADAAERALVLLSDDSGYVRDAVFATILDDWSDEDVLVLAPGLLSPELLVAENVAELLGRRRPEGAAELLSRAALRSPHPSARALMLWALGEIGGPAATATGRETWRKEKRSWEVRAEALSVVARHEGAEARELIDDALGEKKLLPLRVAALRALATFDAAGAFVAASAQLADLPRDRSGVWAPRVELAALRTLGSVPATAVPRETVIATIDALLESLDDATGRLRRARFEALAAITGEELPPTAVSWRAWWGTRRDGWSPSDRPAGGANDAPGGEGEEESGGTAVVRFHGLPVDSTRVTFLQDLSGGMARNLEGERDGPGPTRLDHAKAELARVITALDDHTWANVITFASTYFAARDEPQLLGRARRPIVEFCREQVIPTAPGHARGNVYDALAYAVTSPHVDTIYLVSEGAPTEGKYHDYERFLFHFERLNRWYGARVHVLLVAETGGRNRSFLERLSGGTGGAMRAVTAEE